MKNKKSKTRC